MSPNVLFEIKGPEAVITLNRPAKRNAYDQDMIDAIADGLHKAGANSDVRVVYLAASGPAFSAGVDLTAERGTSIDVRRRRTESLYIGLDRVHKELGKPTIALVDGAARAGGCTIAFMCDMILATRNASFALPEIERGKIPGYHLAYLPRVMGKSKAFSFAFTGRVMDAAEAERLGIVSEVVEDAEALGARRAWYTEQFSKCSAEAIRVAKDVFYHGMDLEFAKAARIAVNGMHVLNAQGEVDKGLNEFERQRREN